MSQRQVPLQEGPKGLAPRSPDVNVRAGPGHPGAWALWALAAALPALTTRNPAYLLLLLLAVAVVHAALPAPSSQASGWWGFLWKAALFLWLVTIPLNALTVHYGQTVLFTLPGSIPVIGGIVGGPVTLEATAYGFLTGLALLAVLAVFITLNRAVDPYQLLRAIPPVLFQTGVMASIALSFVPQAAASLREIREAQAIRGHRWRGLRDVGPLFLPLLTTGLERSLQLAESMEARGFGATPLRDPRARRWGQRLLVVALLFLLAGLVVRGFIGNSPVSTGLLLAGGSALVVALVLHGRSVRRTRYRPRRWSRPDTVVALGAGLAALSYLVLLLALPGALDYSPYPALGWPAFQPVVGALFLLLTGPAWFPARRP
jgi:energy-coupling factor transport system permease protein